jgi:hypothetical protein
MPANTDDVAAALGPYPAPLSPNPGATSTVHPQGRAHCAIGAGGGARTWWTPADQATRVLKDGPSPYTQDQQDEKMLNCVDAYLLTAFCIWDGGRLASASELEQPWLAAKGPYPWSDRASGVTIALGAAANTTGGGQPVGTDPEGRNALSYAVHEFGTYAQDGNAAAAPYSYAWPDALHPMGYIAAPGRKPLGNSATGHADLVGLGAMITRITKDGGIGVGGAEAANGAFTTREIGRAPGSIGGGSAPPYVAGWDLGGRCAR